MPKTTFVFPRESVYLVHFVDHSQNMVIRAQDHEMLECRIRNDRALTRWLAEFLRQELGLPPTTPVGQ
jgi:hypothetical protein